MSVDQGTGHHKPLPISGFTPASQQQVETVNRNKQAEETLLRVMDEHKNNGQIDQRWLAMARTSMEQAFMFWNRAILKPQRVTLPGDE